MTRGGAGARVVVASTGAALLGAILGALVGGYFVLQAQYMAVEQSQRTLALDYAESAADFMADLNNYEALASASKTDAVRRAALADALQRSTFELEMKSDRETADLIAAAVVYVELEVVFGRRSQSSTAGPDPLSDAYSALESQVRAYRAGELPQEGISDASGLLRTLIELGRPGH